jgi:hypothetical protein
MIIFSLLLAMAVPDPLQCNAIAGWDQVLAKKEMRYLVLGEMHGTNEMPAIFADAVCLTAKKRPTIVAVELPETDQPLINAWLVSDGGSEAKQALLAAPFWNGDFKDGRSSEAMFGLLDRLRLMKSKGQIQALVAFQPVHMKNPWANEAYEKGMAKLITDNTPKGATALVLVGNVHAMRTKFERSTVSYLPMAGHLPARKVLSFDIQNDGGLAWVCTGQDICGPTQIGKTTGQSQRGVILPSKRSGPYDGQIFLGVGTTASPPQTTNTKSP